MHPVSNLYRFIALPLALLVLVTSVGFTVDSHFCKGELKSISLLGKAKSCHEVANAQMQCPHHKKMTNTSGETADAKGCCENQSQHFQSDLDKNIQGLQILEISDLQLITIFVKTFFFDSFTEKEEPVFAHYKPPLIARDIPLLVESFLL